MCSHLNCLTFDIISRHVFQSSIGNTDLHCNPLLSYYHFSALLFVSCIVCYVNISMFLCLSFVFVLIFLLFTKKNSQPFHQFGVRL